MRAGNPHAFATSAAYSAVGSQKPRPVQGSTQSNSTDQQPPDCFTVYELFASSVAALISFFLIKDGHVISLNYRTFISQAPEEPELSTRDNSENVSWLTNLNVHWISSGTLLVTTSTIRSQGIQCLDQVSSDEQEDLVGKCVRVAPNASLARIASFEDPLNAAADEPTQLSRRKKAKLNTLEQSIERWKSTVRRWLGWRGYDLPDLEKQSAWIRIRPSRTSQLPALSPGLTSTDRDILWPRTLCFYVRDLPTEVSIVENPESTGPQSTLNDLKWFETPVSTGFKDPIDVALEWFSGKPDRDKMVESRRKAKKAEEEAVRRKEDPAGLCPSSPLNARTGGYGDLQAVSGVYPTPPDGIAPGTSIPASDTPSVSGAPANIILAPGGTTPAINLSAPQEHSRVDGLEQPSTSPLFPDASENYHTSGFDDDLFEDIGGDGAGGIGINDEDFDFFDGPDDDVHMSDAPEMPQGNTEHNVKRAAEQVSMAPEQSIKEEASDPLAALENALAAGGESTNPVVQDEKLASKSSSQQPSSSMSQQKASSDESSGPKGPTPPLSPRMIASTLQMSPSNKRASKVPQVDEPPNQADGAFHPLDFSRRLSLFDAKYQEGRFAVDQESNALNEGSRNSSGPLRMKSLRDMPLLNKLRYAVGVASAASVSAVTPLTHPISDDSDSSSETSDASEEDELADELPAAPPPPFLGRLIIPAKRKLPTEGNATPMSVTSFAESLGGDWLDLHGLQLDDTFLASFEPNSWDWSILDFTPPVERPLAGARYAMPALPPPIAQLPDTPTSQPDVSTDLLDERPPNGKDSIVVTQILTDQVVSATLDLLGENRSLVVHTVPSNETRWQHIVREVFPKATECAIPTLASLHDVFPDLSAQVKGQQRALPRKPNESSAIPGNHIYQINAPFVRVRRAETHWDLLPPSIAFWEPLGLAPTSPPKNVIAFCIYPHSDPLRPLLERFLLNVQIAYDTCKLGSHTRVDTVSEYEGGLVPCKINSSAPSSKEAFKALRETCVQLGKLLAIQHNQIREQQDAKIDAFVIYMVDPFGISGALWELCSAFWTLFHAYGQVSPGRSDQAQKPDLVLQIVPMKYIASFDAPVVLDSGIYMNLAREVYDRCPPSAPSTDKTPLNIYKAPAFQLEEALPRGIPFKLVSEPPQDLLRENSYMHLAYSMSLDGTWVTAAWTDNCGKSQAVVSYHLGARTFGEVAKEIWQTTIEILQSRRVQWRVCIAKSGIMDREELETWVLLITCPTQVNLFLTLLTVVTDPTYKLTPTTPAGSNTAGQSTPGSTPQAGVSPDPAMGLTPAATPSADAPDPAADPDTRLIDVTDETWGVILAHRLHNSNSTNQFIPALISGLLVKRGETLATRNSAQQQVPEYTPGPITVAVNILWIGAVGSTRAATSPFPPTADGVSPSGYGAAGASSAPPSPSPAQERSTSSLMWTPTVQTRATAENLLKEVLGQFRGLGLLAKLRGMRGTKHGTIPWHVVAAQRGVDGLTKVTGGMQ